MRIELLWFEGCPNHAVAETLLRSVIRQMGVDAKIESIEVGDEPTARRVAFPGSPTIRVNGQDVEPGWQPSGEYTFRCRVYSTPGGLKGVPEGGWIKTAILAAIENEQR